MTYLFKVIFLIFFIVFSTTSLSCPYNPFPKHYLGFEVSNLHIYFVENYGGNLMKKDMQGGSLLAGLIFDDNFSTEVGYQHLYSSRAATLPAGSYAAGTYIFTLLSPATFKSKATFKSPYIKFLVTTKKLNPIPIQFFSGVGISYTTAMFSRKTMQMSIISTGTKRKMSVSHTIPSLIFGFNYFLTNDTMLTNSITLSKTKKLNAFASDGHAPAMFWPEIRTKNSICYSLGIRVKI